MGSIIRLNTQFNNNKLQTLQDYNTDTLKAQILALPTLRAFYDATDRTTMQLTGNRVTQLNDQSINQLHFVQSNTTNSPTYDAQAFGHTGGLVFSGNQWLTAANLFGGKQIGSIVVFAKGANPGLSIIISSASNTAIALYTRENAIVALNGGTGITAPNAHIRPTNITLSYDTTKKYANIEPSYEHSDTANSSGGVSINVSAANLGRWANNNESGKYIGNIGHVMMFDEDLSANQAVLDLVNEYAKRKYRIGE